MTRTTYRNPTETITILAPDLIKRKSFTLRLERVDERGKKTTCSKKYKQNERLRTINENYKSKILDLNTARILIENLKKDLVTELNQASNVQDNIAINKANLALYNRYWNKVYMEKDVLSHSIDSARNAYQRVLKAIGDVSLISCTKQELIKQWAKYEAPYQSKQRDCSRLNSLLIFAKRDFTHTMKKIEITYADDKTWISHDDSIILINELSRESDRIGNELLFFLGLRISELMGLEGPSNYDSRSGKLFIRQMVIQSSKGYKLPKCDVQREIPVASFLKDSLKTWLKIPIEKRAKDVSNFGKRLKNASRKCWPYQETKQVSPHGMRRSFAKHYYAKGFSVSELAVMMGDNEKTVRENYLGLKLTDEMHKSIKSKLDNLL